MSNVVDDDIGPTVWEAAQGAKVPDDAWEYRLRKARNDAAYRGLDYVPYSSTMPVRSHDDEEAHIKWTWKKKGKH